MSGICYEGWCLCCTKGNIASWPLEKRSLLLWFYFCAFKFRNILRMLSETQISTWSTTKARWQGYLVTTRDSKQLLNNSKSKCVQTKLPYSGVQSYRYSNWLLRFRVLLHEEYTRKAHNLGSYHLNLSWQDLFPRLESRSPVDWTALEATEALDDRWLLDQLSPPPSPNTLRSSKQLSSGINSSMVSLCS